MLNKMANGKKGFSVMFMVIIAAVVILGLAAIFTLSNMKYNVSTQPDAKQVEVDGQVKALDTQSSSDEIGDIEKDIKDTNLDILDEDLVEINSDIESL